MFYPGQIVYVDCKDELAMFLGIVPGKTGRQIDDDFEVLLHDSVDPHLSDTELFEVKDLKFLIQPDKTTLTGTSIYYGPKDKNGAYLFRKKHWTSKMPQEELDIIKKDVIELMNSLRKEKWVSKYFKNVSHTEAETDLR